MASKQAGGENSESQMKEPADQPGVAPGAIDSELDVESMAAAAVSESIPGESMAATPLEGWSGTLEGDAEPGEGEGGGWVNRLVRADRERVSARWRRTAAIGWSLALALGVGSWLLWTRGERSRIEAEHAQNQAQLDRNAIDELVATLAEGAPSDPAALDPLRRELFAEVRRADERYLARLEESGEEISGARGSGGDVASAVMSRRMEAARVRSRIGRISRLLDSPEMAETLLRRAVESWEGVIAGSPSVSTGATLALAETLRELALALLSNRETRAEASRVLLRAQNLLLDEGFDQERPDSRAREHLLSLVLVDLAEERMDQGHADEAEVLLDNVIAIETRLSSSDPQSLADRMTLAAAESARARAAVQIHSGVPRALEAYNHAILLREQIAQERPDRDDNTLQLAQDLADLAALIGSERREEATAMARRSVMLLEMLDRRSPGVDRYLENLAAASLLLGELELRRDDPSAALIQARRARSLFEGFDGRSPADPRNRLNLARSLRLEGRSLKQLDQPSEALASLQRAVDLVESFPEIEPETSLQLARDLALCVALLDQSKAKTPEAAEPAPKPAGDRGGVDSGTPNPEPASPPTPKQVNEPKPVRPSPTEGRKRRYAERAISALQDAVDAGVVRASSLAADPDLSSLSGRDDFKALVRD
jgi:tetratricopeptide (TPR) repeat protein